MVGSVKVSGEWLLLEPHGPFYTGPGPAAPVPPASMDAVALQGVPRVDGWDHAGYRKGHASNRMGQASLRPV